MHELGIAIAIADLASQELSRLGAVEVTAVHVRVGALSGVAKEALLFSFDAAAAGTPLEGAQLRIEDVPASVWCPRCDIEREIPDARDRRCPACHSPAPRLVRGDELQMTGLEVRPV